jgi:ABC-type lipoprotein export system ATPase subunit
VIESISVLGGRGKSGEAEPVSEVTLRMGEVVSIVGPTGSGKTTLISDLDLLADGTSPTRRRVLVNGVVPLREYRDSPANHPIATITQHTNFLSDLPVEEFLTIHAQIRSSDGRGGATTVRETMDFANELTGEPIEPRWRMTELSGGQTRALLIADAVVIGNSPIVLLDEIENAGIHRMRALELLRRHRKIFVFVTHDPYIALLSDYRVVMRGGMMAKVVRTNEAERELSVRVRRVDDALFHLREGIRQGLSFSAGEFAAAL